MQPAKERYKFNENSPTINNMQSDIVTKSSICVDVADDSFVDVDVADTSVNEMLVKEGKDSETYQIDLNSEIVNVEKRPTIISMQSAIAVKSSSCVDGSDSLVNVVDKNVVEMLVKEGKDSVILMEVPSEAGNKSLDEQLVHKNDKGQSRPPLTEDQFNRLREVQSRTVFIEGYKDYLRKYFKHIPRQLNKKRFWRKQGVRLIKSI